MPYTPPTQSTIAFDFSLDTDAYEVPGQTTIAFSFLPLVEVSALENLGLADAIARSWSLSLVQNLILSEAFSFQLGVEAAENLNAADSATALCAYMAAENLRGVDSASATLALTAALQEQMGLSDSITAGLGLLLSENLDIADTTGETIYRICLAVEVLALGETATPSLHITAELLEALSLAEVAKFIHGLTAEEALGVADQLSVALRAKLTAAETLDIADAVSQAFTIICAAEESLGVEETSAVQMIMQLLAAESLAFIGTLPLDGDDYQVLVVNSDTRGPTTYTSWPFTSYAELDGRYFGAMPGGIYELIGETDAGTNIDAYIQTGFMGFDPTGELGIARNLKRMPVAYLYITTTDRIVLKVFSDRRGVRQSRWYELTAEAGSAKNMRRKLLTRDIAAVQWAFQVRNTAGGKLDLEGADIYPVVLNRKV